MIDRIESFVFSEKMCIFVFYANIGWCLCALRAGFATSADAWWMICIGALGLFFMNCLILALYFLIAYLTISVVKLLVWMLRTVIA